MKKNLSLYVHIPFCVKKCNYCDFLSGPASEAVKESYVNVLCQEIEKEAAFYPEHRIETVFFGGGTPTVLKTEQLERILCKLKCSFGFKSIYHMEGSRAVGWLSDLKGKEQETEITLECNPGTVDEESLKKLYDAGFNRLSIGLQSAQDKELKTLGRIHDWRSFLETYDAARKVGFHNINIDIMSALPGQSVASYQDTLKKVLSLRPEHISAYSLIIEEGTPFYEKYAEADRQRSVDGEDAKHLLPAEEEERQMYELTEKLLEEGGYHRYEISNYALSGYECRHNMIYWKRGNYLGLGLGAASLMENTRFTKENDLTKYLEGGWKERKEVQHLTRLEQIEEFMFLGLRLTEGVSCREFRKCFGTEIKEVYGKVIEKLEKQGLLYRKGEYFCLTKYGVDISNVVLAEFLL